MLTSVDLSLNILFIFNDFKRIVFALLGFITFNILIIIIHEFLHAIIFPEKLSSDNIGFDDKIVDDISEYQKTILQLRSEYERQIVLPFRQRDQNLDDLWFNSMSTQIKNLTFLLYTLKEQYDLNIFQKKYIEVFYLLTILRNDSGPVVSYLKGGSFNSASLTDARIDAIRFNKRHTDDAIRELTTLAKNLFSVEINTKISDFIEFRTLIFIY